MTYNRCIIERDLDYLHYGSETWHQLKRKGGWNDFYKVFFKGYFFFFRAKSDFHTHTHTQICLAWHFTLMWHCEESIFPTPPKQKKEKGTNGYRAALRVLLPVGWGAGSHRAPLWGQQDVLAKSTALPQPGVAQRSRPSPRFWALPWRKGWPRLGHEISGRVWLPGWGTAVVLLEWQLRDSPAHSQAPTVTVVQRIRAQLILFLFNEAI